MYFLRARNDLAALILAPFIVTFLISSCAELLNEKVCTDAGCNDGYRLTFNLENNASSIGDYSIIVQTESDEVLSCSFSVSAIGNECQHGDCLSQRACDDLQGAFHDMSEERVYLWYPRLEGLLRISIVQDGEELAKFTSRPNYDSFRPNGPGCEPVCFEATEEIELAR